MYSLCLTAHPCAGYQSASSYIKSDVELSFTGVEFIKSIRSNCGKILIN